MKKIALLGATGSVGASTLDVLANHPEKFTLSTFSFYNNIQKAREIIQDFSPQLVACGFLEQAMQLKREFPKITFTSGMEGLIQAAVFEEVDIVLTAITGSIGLKPTLKAIEARKDIALANKETLVMAGKWIMEKVHEYGVKLLPVDSEHSAIFQCLQGQDAKALKNLIITASGGSFRDKTRAELVNVTVDETLNHPNWSMGKKITIDSSTMVNKGLEVIEAHFLFNVPYENIQVILHRQSIVHSMVEFKDGAYIAQLGASDMREPILYALTYPKREVMIAPKAFDLAQINTLQFEQMDFNRFPLIALAYEVGKKGGSFPTVYNAANEIVANAFIARKISYLAIEEYVIKAVNEHQEMQELNLEKIIEIDLATRRKVTKWIKEMEEKL
ncbi:MAG: 1-deoxy-D-xylulose-5-phosphate reductoisomerase [Streptococcaceae bacterium]|nr:1-deoxy-D-xylulose-5-phosphate reductoisomerase [Streptococcaceae bacterium]